MKKIERIEKMLSNLTYNVARDIKNEIKEIVSSGERTGIHYKGMPNRSSAPGEPPAKQSGKLINKKNLIVVKTQNGYNVELNSPYAYYLEFGTKKMAPRPYIKKSIDKVLKNNE